MLEKEFSWHRTGKVNLTYEAVVITLFEVFMEDAIRERLGDSGAVAVEL
jgi:hypothetical protein